LGQYSITGNYSFHSFAGPLSLIEALFDLRDLSDFALLV